MFFIKHLQREPTCRAYIQVAVITHRNKEYIADDTMACLECNCGIKGFLVGVEWFILYGGGIFFVNGLQYPARFVLDAIDVDLYPGVFPGDFPAQRRHDDFRIGHGFSQTAMKDGSSEVKGVRAHLLLI